MDQPGKVANPARGQLNRENNIPLSPCVPENLVSRDGFSRPVPRQPAHLHTQAESGAYLRDSSRVPRRRPYETAIRHRVSPEFIGSRSCVPMAFTAESPPAHILIVGNLYGQKPVKNFKNWKDTNSRVRRSQSTCVPPLSQSRECPAATNLTGISNMGSRPVA